MDFVIFRSSLNNEIEKEVEPGYWTWFCDIEKVKEDVEQSLKYYTKALNVKNYKLCLSDEQNFRKDVLPDYKSNRNKKKKPLALKMIKKWLLEERNGVVFPRTEGDDALGILQDKDTIIVSPDKDMQTIPGRLFRNGKIVTVSEEEADYYHLLQTLTGDQGDGYGGCKGIGAAKAKKALDKDCSWNTVVSLYEEQGFTEEDALVQARMARILRKEDWNFEKNEPILWSPK